MTATAANRRDGSDRGREGMVPTWRPTLAATAAVAMVYVYFLIFAQFGFLKLLQTAGGGADLLKPVMAVMGAGGLIASAGVARFYTEARGRLLLVGSFVIAGCAAALALFADSAATFFATAALTGVGTGGATVALAPHLKRSVGMARLGRCVGLGTGLAYGICNLPGIFAATPRVQALVALTAAGIGAATAFGFPRRLDGGGANQTGPRALGVGFWTLIFLLLVWLDSAAFYLIQHTPALQEKTWAGDRQLYLNALVHWIMAVMAGWALDRGWGSGVTGLATLLLVCACLLLGNHTSPGAAIALLYVSGVSLYSTVLVFYPASSGRVAVAAIVYSVAGWIGSALGIAMAEKWRDVPHWFLAGAASLIVLAILANRWEKGRPCKMNKD